MICEVCNIREACIHFTVLVGGEIKKVHMCEECIQKQGLDNADLYPQGGILGSLLSMLGMAPGSSLSDLADPSKTSGESQNPIPPIQTTPPPVQQTTGPKSYRHPELAMRIDQDVECPKCKTTMRQVLALGKLNCDYCHHAFAKPLEDIILFYNAVHSGGMPTRKTDAIAELKKKLAEAVKKEHYEEAAEIRDRIHKIENTNDKTFFDLIKSRKEHIFPFLMIAVTLL